MYTLVVSLRFVGLLIVELLAVEMDLSLTHSFECSWESFSLFRLPCPVFFMPGLLSCLIVSCFILFGCYLLEVNFFEEEIEGEFIWEIGEVGELVEIDGGETVLRMYV